MQQEPHTSGTLGKQGGNGNFREKRTPVCGFKGMWTSEPSQWQKTFSPQRTFLWAGFLINIPGHSRVMENPKILSHSVKTSKLYLISLKILHKHD